MDQNTLHLLAGLAHDLRTPLSAIAGHASLLSMGAHGALTEAQAASMRRIENNQKQLVAMIGDFLSYAEAASGSIDLAPNACAIRPLVTQAVDALQRLALARSVRVDWSADQAMDDSNNKSVHDPTADLVQTDAGATLTVIKTLLEDALAHSERDSVIHVRVTRAKAVLIVTVDSAGRAISDDAVERLFEPYMRDASGRQLYTPGRSLSLPYARALARAMGAEVRAVPSSVRRVLRLELQGPANLRPLVG